MAAALSVAAPARLQKLISKTNKLLSGPGPSNLHPSVAAAMQAPLLGHLHPEFVEIMDDVKAGIKYLFQTENEWTFAISGPGHSAMEAASANLLEAGDRVLVCHNGVWADRFLEISNRHGATAVILRKPAGSTFELSDIQHALTLHSPSVVFVTHCESSTGALQQLQGIGKLCHSHNSLLIVDSVAACGGVPLLTDAWEIDCVYTGAQKCLSSSPGLSPISFSPLSVAKILRRAKPPVSFSLDAALLADYWSCVQGRTVRSYHHTAPISLMFAMREALRLLAAEGLQAAWMRHGAAHRMLLDGLRQIGLQCFVADADSRAPTVTAVIVPDGVSWKAFADYAMKHHSVEIAGGLGPTAGRVWRLGLMGANANKETVQRLLHALRDSYRAATDAAAAAARI